jgi:hypothetical protein
VHDSELPDFNASQREHVEEKFGMVNVTSHAIRYEDVVKSRIAYSIR